MCVCVCELIEAKERKENIKASVVFARKLRSCKKNKFFSAFDFFFSNLLLIFLCCQKKKLKVEEKEKNLEAFATVSKETDHDPSVIPNCYTSSSALRSGPSVH